MKPLVEFFDDYLFGETPKSLFHQVYVEDRGTPDEPIDRKRALRRFLDSRLDINRLKAATQFIDESIFEINAWPELGQLRDAVAEREVRQGMRYQKYRDHTCHTLWGFIFGCLLYESSPRMQQLLKPLLDGNTDETVPSVKAFGGMWILGFLCHDIGYLFESDIPRGLTPNPLTDLQAACALLNDFYLGYYVSKYVGDSTTQNLKELEKFDYPDFPNNSLSAVAQALRKLPFADTRLLDRSGQSLKVPRDAFDLFKWAKCPGSESVEVAFRFLYQNGMYGQKFLDHGIVSGLLMAQLLILGYGLHMLARRPGKNSKFDKAFLKEVQERTEYDQDLTIHMIQRRTRWIFGATRHNVDPDWWNSVKNKPAIQAAPPDKLRCEQDAPSYFVVLVDTLQDWDRPRMKPNTHVDDFIMDSADLLLEVTGGRVRIAGSPGYATQRLKDLQEDLEARLFGWTDFVEIVV